MLLLVNYTLYYTLHNTLHYTTLHITHYTLHVTRYTLHITHYTLHITHYTLHITHYTLHISHFTLHITHYTLHVTRYTLHITHYTLHITHYTLHITHYTLHITHHIAIVQFKALAKPARQFSHVVQICHARLVTTLRQHPFCVSNVFLHFFPEPSTGPTNKICSCYQFLNSCDTSNRTEMASYDITAFVINFGMTRNHVSTIHSLTIHRSSSVGSSHISRLNL